MGLPMPVQTRISQLPNFDPVAIQAERLRRQQEHQAAQEEWEANAERRQFEAKMIELWDKSGVGDLHAGAKLEELMEHTQWAKAWAACQRVVDMRGMLVLLGDRGNGKTQVAVELVRMCCKQMQRCLYTRTRQVGMAIRESYGNPSISEMSVVKQFTGPFLLVLDEVQEKPDTEFESRTLTMILDMRYEAKKPTVLIANATAAQFKKMVGPSIVDRIHDRGSTVMFDWPSFRRAK